MDLTEWYEPAIKPVRVGWYEASFFDCGWMYEWRVWWDGHIWRASPEGNSLVGQYITWRGMEKPNDEQL
jgi:hypothetical protein